MKEYTVPKKHSLNENSFQPLVEISLPWKKKDANDRAKDNLKAADKADKKLKAAGEKLAANDLNPKNRDYEFYLATGKNKWSSDPLTHTEIRQKFQSKELTVESPEFLNALVVNAGFLSRRGMESLYGKGIEFDPARMSTIKIRDGYSVPFPETTRDDKTAGADTTSDDESSKETTASADNVDAKSVNVTKKVLSQLNLLQTFTGIEVQDAAGKRVKIGSITADNINSYNVKVGNKKPVPLTDWLALSKKWGLIKESFRLTGHTLETLLTEAPQLFFDDDELNNPDAINMKDIIKNRQARETAQKAAAELNAKRQALQAKYGSVLDAVETSIGNGNSTLDTLEVLFDTLVPSDGKADTVAGELVRALMRLIARDNNDGDKFYEGYGIETCASSAEYLHDNGFDMQLQNIVDTIPDDDLYTNSLNKLADKLIEKILSEPELVTEPNSEDSREYESAEWDVEEHQPRYEFEISASDGVERLVENGILNAWDLQSYVESSLEYEPWYDSDVTIERPWSHTSTTVELTNLTRDAYDDLQNMFMDDDKLDRFWQDLVNEYSDELTDDDSEEDSDFDD